MMMIMGLLLLDDDVHADEDEDADGAEDESEQGTIPPSTHARRVGNRSTHQYYL